jgi:hypothetical protein
MGRKLTCSTCGEVKEEAVKNESQCKACKAERNRKARQAKRLAEGKTAICEREPHCDECKEKKANGESIAGKCTPCVVISNKLRLHAKREEQGLAPVAIRDVLFCHVCQIPKIDGRCPPCRSKAAAARKAKKREEAGKRPWGAGRPLTCYLCNEVKEKPDASYCNSCASEDNKKRWKDVYAPRVNQKEVTLICECGKEKESTRKFYCIECLKKRKRDRNKVSSQHRRDKLKIDGVIVVPTPLTVEQRSMRQAARDYINRLIRQGVVTRLNCEVCGSQKNVEAHHDDYTRPLDIRWLCRVHHDEHHKRND